MLNVGINIENPLSKVFSQTDQITIGEAAALVQSGSNTPLMVMPFTFILPNNQQWTLPIEPLVSVNGRNQIVKRNVSKSASRGSIKERWTEGDCSITIHGTFMGADMNTYPANEVEKLRSMVMEKKAIQVTCELLQLLNISYLVIESYNLPFSKGENVQNFTIEAVSDDSYNLFIDVKK